jgi:hypothetical protein
VVAEDPLAVDERLVEQLRDAGPPGAGQLGLDRGGLVEDVAQAQHQGGAAALGGVQPVSQLAGRAVRVPVDDHHVRADLVDGGAEGGRPGGQRLLDGHPGVAVSTRGVLEQRRHRHDPHALPQPGRPHREPGDHDDLRLGLPGEDGPGHERVPPYVSQTEPVMGGEQIPGHVIDPDTRT